MRWLMKLSKLTKPELEKILENANFTKEEEIIFLMLSKGKSLEEISAKTFLPIATVNNSSYMGKNYTYTR